jgi:DNA primase
MAKSSFIDFKAIKAAVTIEQLLQHYGILDQFKRSGDSLSGPCPIHGGTNPTQFRASISKNCWNCFSECKGGGNVLDFVARKENVSIHKAARLLCEWFSLPAETEKKNGERRRDAKQQSSNTAELNNHPPKARSASAQEANVNKPLGFELQNLDAKHPYLAERGLDESTVNEFGLGFCAKGSMAGRIVIPIHNPAGQLVAYSGRWPGEPPKDTAKYKLPVGFKKSLEVFNLRRAIREPVNRPLLIVEGFFGCIHLWQLGYKRVVALMGSSISPSQVELIREHTSRQSQVIILLDEDDAGRIGREEVVQALSPFVFVRQCAFAEEGRQPEDLTQVELADITGGLCEGL